MPNLRAAGGSDRQTWEELMTTTVSDFPNVIERLAELGCTVPSTLAFLPSNLDSASKSSELAVQGQATTLTKVLRQGGIEVGAVMPETAPPGFIHNKSHDWVVPIVFISAELMKTSPDIVGIAIDLIRDYLISLFKGLSGSKAIKAEIVVEKRKGGTYRRLPMTGILRA
jgi:hypothetical protein